MTIAVPSARVLPGISRGEGGGPIRDGDGHCGFRDRAAGVAFVTGRSCRTGVGDHVITSRTIVPRRPPLRRGTAGRAVA